MGISKHAGRRIGDVAIALAQILEWLSRPAAPSELADQWQRLPRERVHRQMDQIRVATSGCLGQ